MPVPAGAGGAGAHAGAGRARGGGAWRQLVHARDAYSDESTPVVITILAVVGCVVAAIAHSIISIVGCVVAIALIIVVGRMVVALGGKALKVAARVSNGEVCGPGSIAIAAPSLCQPLLQGPSVRCAMPASRDVVYSATISTRARGKVARMRAHRPTMALGGRLKGGLRRCYNALLRC